MTLKYGQLPSMFLRLTDFASYTIVDPPWRYIRILGEAKVLGISATVIVVVPLMSRFLIFLKSGGERLSELVSWVSPLAQKEFTTLVATVELPFSLKLLVVSALSAMIGKTIYEIACPAYIKSSESFTTFRHSNPQALSALERDLLRRLNVCIMDSYAANVLKDKLNNYSLILEQPSLSGNATIMTPETVFTFNSPTQMFPRGRLSTVLQYAGIGEPIFLYYGKYMIMFVDHGD